MPRWAIVLVAAFVLVIGIQAVMLVAGGDNDEPGSTLPVETITTQ